jgi:hypothetical protein
MSAERRGIGSIRTLRAVLSSRARRTAATALQELSSLATERELLERELERGRRREQEILRRLAEVAAQEGELRSIAGLAADPGPLAKPKVSDLPRTFQTRDLSY